MSVIVKFQCGLGNQLFQYAYLQALQKNIQEDVYCDNSEFFRKKQDRAFDLAHYTITDLKFKKPQRKFFQYYIRRILKNFFKDNAARRKFQQREGLIKAPIYKIEDSFRYDESFLNIKSPAYIIGFFQNEKYFKDIAPTIRQNLQLKTPLTAENKEMLQKIQSSLSISLHIRRSDYLDANDIWGICSIQYYQHALEQLSMHIPLEKAHIFIFSDDIEWCKSNLPIEYLHTFVNINSHEQAYYDLELMRNCKHNIIANSSFSWWGAWLNEHENKIVIAPDPWFKNRYNGTSPVPENWIKIDPYFT